VRQELRGAAVVITGASSGIGRAAALMFAEHGANVIVAARREAPLQELAAECEARGVRALAVPVDVTDEAAVIEVAQRAVDALGRLDVWINNAGVTLLARFEDAPPDAFRRVIETNFFGYVYGTRAALPHFRRQGGGVLIYNASIHALGGAPYESAYVSSKFAVRGFTESLRQELLGTDIHVCTLFPSAIDTPLFQHAGNYTGRAAKPLNPTYDAAQVARAMVLCAERPRREMYVGSAGHMVGLLHNVAPALYERVMVRQVETDEFQNALAPLTPGNIFAPMAEGTGSSGGWKAPTPEWQRTAASLARRAAPVALATAGAVPAMLAWRWWRK
jgi:NAD(P)-dependent dehydrogenase (short-subunit alcohol dehydrogenase family)